MDPKGLVLGLLVMLLSLAGCFGNDGGGSAEYECRERSITLQVGSSTSSSIPVYTLNDNETQMRIVAMGFSAPGGELEVPNPMIGGDGSLMECDTLILTLTNDNPLEHTFHLHGGLMDWQHDGVPFLSQLPLHQGESFTYRFENLKAGTYWFHCHVDVAHHIDLGMYGAFIVQEREPIAEYDFDKPEHVLMFDEWDNCHVHGGIDPRGQRESGNYPAGDADCEGRKFQDYYAQNALDDTATDPLCRDPNVPQQIKDQLGCHAHGDPPAAGQERTWYFETFPPYAPLYNTYTINGKAFPDTKAIFFEEDKLYRFRLINVGEEMHSIHIHGHNMQVIARDGYPTPAPFRVDTLGIMPGERYDVVITADNPGFWAFHDHVGLNVANDYQSPGGMFTVIAYTGDFANEVGFAPKVGMKAIEVYHFTKAYHDQHGHQHEGASPDAVPMKIVRENGVTRWA